MPLPALPDIVLQDELSDLRLDGHDQLDDGLHSLIFECLCFHRPAEELVIPHILDDFYFGFECAYLVFHSSLHELYQVIEASCCRFQPFSHDPPKHSSGPVLQCQLALVQRSIRWVALIDRSSSKSQSMTYSVLEHILASAWAKSLLPTTSQHAQPQINRQFGTTSRCCLFLRHQRLRSLANDLIQHIQRHDFPNT